MAEGHPTADQLIALALGGLLPDEQTALLEHLDDCRACRATYDEVSRTMDAVLPAAPAVAPPAGFEARVLDRLQLRRPARRRPYRVPVLVAAAAAVGIGLGAGVVTIIGNDRSPTPAPITASDRGAVLVTSTGSTVGTVEPSLAGDQRVMVMQITDGRPGAHYTCRLLLKDGTARDAGDWWVPESGRATWIAYGAAVAVDRVELRTDDGRPWSIADLDD
ncbi:hypothetical protein HRW16_23470 [Streptomyces lunaelactis]|uniref:hypothetical protein n=1 Tax=Streptomyces lunaelactis TaxID=1535768 RepID=UPI0015845E72|nr:hypothetical protein [Streptomyces lunaelactis]NUK94738.1 hypothetical protein [Streptomyces lunaelactis]